MTFSVNAYSQACSGNNVTITFENFTTPTASSFEFDVRISNSGTTALKLAQLGGAIFYNVGMTTAGTFSKVSEPAANDFPTLNIIATTAHTTASRQLRWTNNPVTEGSSVVLPAGVTKTFARFRYTTSTPSTFPQNYTATLTPAINFATGVSNVSALVYCNGNASSTVLSNPVVAPTLSGLITIPSPYTVTLNPASGPTASVLSGSATICASTSTNLSVAVTGGISPYTVTVTDGTNNYSATGASPVSIAVSPTSTSTYTISSVTGGGIGTGNTGSATVTVTPASNTGSVSTSICAGDSYVWPANGQTYTTAQSGVTEITGCNTATLNLTITPSSTNTTTITACDSYVWNGTTYTTSGVYTGTTANCVTESLDLTITTGGTSNITTISACGTYTWANNGQTYTTSGVYTGTTTNCVTEFLNLTITPSSTNTISITACGSYVWNGTTYASSGVYTGTTTNCITQSLNLTITPPDTNTVNVNATPTYFWVFTGQIYTVSGTYQFLDLNNCVLEILNLSLTNDIAEESSNAFTIFPNPTNGNVVISLFSDDQCGLNVYDSQGQLVFENPSISNGEAVNLSNYSPGVYIFRVYTSNQIYTRRIIKN